MAIKNAKALAKPPLRSVTRAIYLFIGFYVLSIIIFDAGNLITRETVINRWTLASVLFAINTLVWFVSTQSKLSTKKLATIAISVMLMVFAGLMTYWERGMASTSTIFYALPILTIATLKNRNAVIAFGALSAATYAFSAVKYFNDFFNEGYRVQLWGNIVLYAGAIIAISWLIIAAFELKNKE